MPSLQQLSTAQLRQALQLSEEIDKLQHRLESLLGGSGAELLSAADKPAKRGGGRGGKRTMSAEGRAKIAAAARARWAKLRSANGKPAAVAKPAKGKKAKGNASANASVAPKKASVGKGRNLTPEGRAKLAAAMKARWEARKKSATA